MNGGSHFDLFEGPNTSFAGKPRDTYIRRRVMGLDSNLLCLYFGYRFENNNKESCEIDLKI